MSKFLSTLSLRRATRFFDVSLNYFYPRSPCGERLNKRCEFNGDNRFLSTLSLRRATVSVWCFCGGAFGFLSTLSLRRATADAPQDGPQLGFLSTLSLRRATNLKNTASRCRGYFYPRSPCGERRLSYFYIIKITQFLSTLSLRRATIPDREPAAGYLISIHALLAESDPTRWAPTCRISNFYPRSPCGERHECTSFAPKPKTFLSTLSLRRATDTLSTPNRQKEFLSTLSLRRATPAQGSAHPVRFYFYPRSPCGERRYKSRKCPQCHRFLSTLSLRRATHPAASHCYPPAYFYPRSPCGERLPAETC